MEAPHAKIINIIIIIISIIISTTIIIIIVSAIIIIPSVPTAPNRFLEKRDEPSLP